jgi:hypothetical protein
VGRRRDFDEHLGFAGRGRIGWGRVILPNTTERDREVLAKS